jgi:hypothetical protein
MVVESIRYILWATIMGLAICPIYVTEFSTTMERLWRVTLGLALGLFLYFGLALVFKCPHAISAKNAVLKWIAKLRQRKANKTPSKA